jgi:hypothetical protein
MHSASTLIGLSIRIKLQVLPALRFTGNSLQRI